MAELTSRAEVIEILGRVAHRGSLGLFLGTGFSIAVTGGAAPRWRALLEGIAQELSLPNPCGKADAIIGMSFPDLATEMVFGLAEKLSGDWRYGALPLKERRVVAEAQVKEAAAQLVAPLQPVSGDWDEFHALFHAIKPAWVVTTNYDDLFQKIHGKTRTFLPNDALVPTHEIVPVWHIHGSVVVPKSLVLTQEDYVENLRPGIYRQSKLAHMMLESTTLMLGYGYGDVNVQTAAAIARSSGLLLTRPTRRPGDSLIVHVLRTGGAVSEQVKTGREGTVVIEAAEIKVLLQEIQAKNQELAEAYKRADNLFQAVQSNPDLVVGEILEHPDRVAKLVRLLRDYPSLYYDSDIVALLGKFFSQLAQKAYSPGGFSHYGTWLDHVFTMLLEWDLADMPPAVFDLLAGQLAKVVYYVDSDDRRTVGKSWAATDTWAKNREKLARRTDLMEALHAYSRRVSEGGMLNLLLNAIAR